MFFTDGETQEYERLMQMPPCLEGKPNGKARRKEQSRKEEKAGRDCPYCLYYSDATRKCVEEYCVVFDE
jgi:hypothetical protein